ncbi:putative CMP-sialic acid transporter 1 [Paratrimastix pyriformis]|uniref:CMP-sialic acid transporter 1 n=1 Tax=Paratrimastix pyriformis TaxID=342808 RepID=A0ABQ8UHI2_9EUKA|nr:putative CMP-sialic acid transporter 1 [Paratrimastix pyriformis]
MASALAKSAIILANTILVVIYLQLSARHGKSKSDTALIVLFAEMMKFLFSAAMTYSMRHRKGVVIKFEVNRFLMWGLPSIIYFVQNNVSNSAFHYLDGPTYALLGNFRLVITPLLSLFFLRKWIGAQRWCAILSAFFGVLMSELNPCAGSSSSPASATESSFFVVHPLGLLFGLLVPACSALAGVITEKFMKDPAYAQEPIHWQNLQLYTFGIVCNAALAVGQGVLTNPPSLAALGEKFTISFLLASIGILTSLTIKYLDNIRKNFTTVFALFGSTFVTSLATWTRPSTPFLIGACVVSVAQISYTLAQMQEDKDRTLAAQQHPPHSPA